MLNPLSAISVSENQHIDVIKSGVAGLGYELPIPYFHRSIISSDENIPRSVNHTPIQQRPIFQGLIIERCQGIWSQLQ